MTQTSLAQHDTLNNELIKHFFHDNSYFYFCLRRHFRTPEFKRISAETWQLLGKVVGQLLDAEEPQQGLLALSADPRFQPFTQSLEDGMDELATDGLSQEEMKSIIDGMACAFGDSLVAMAQTPVARLRLLDFLAAGQMRAGLTQYEDLDELDDTEDAARTPAASDHPRNSPSPPPLDFDDFDIQQSPYQDYDPEATISSEAGERTPASSTEPESAEAGDAEDERGQAAELAEPDDEPVTAGDPEPDFDDWETEIAGAAPTLPDSGEDLQSPAADESYPTAMPASYAEVEPLAEALPQDDEQAASDVDNTEEPAPMADSGASADTGDIFPANEPEPDADPARPQALDDSSETDSTVSSAPSAETEAQADDIEPDSASGASDEPLEAKAAPDTSISQAGAGETEATAGRNIGTKAGDRAEGPHEIRRAFRTQVAALIALLRGSESNERTDGVPQQALRSLNTALQNLRESASIHDIDGIGELADEAQSRVGQLLLEHAHLAEHLARLLELVDQKVGDVLHEAPSGRTSQNLRALVQAISTVYARPEDSASASASDAAPDGTKADKAQAAVFPAPVVTEAEDSMAEQDETPPADIPERAQSFTSARMDLDFRVDEEDGTTLVAEDDDQSETPAQPPVHSGVDFLSTEPDVAGNGAGGVDDEVDESFRKLKLPGEDDPDLQSIVAEILQSNAAATREAATDLRAPERDATPEGKVKPAEEDSADDSGSSKAYVAEFQSEAELYFNVAAKAIEQLAATKDDRLALENLELAAYSLKGLTRKLSLERLSTFPELVEELVGKAILLRMALTNRTLEIVEAGFEAMKTLQSAGDIEQSELLEIENKLRRFIHSLDEQDFHFKHSQKIFNGLPK